MGLNMRNFKFRIYNKVKKHWTQYGFDILGEISIMGYIGYDGHDNKSIPLMELNDLVVTQFTGVQDKNGKEIYDGDIISIGEHWIGDSRIPKRNYIVEWHAPEYSCKAIGCNEWEELDWNNNFLEVLGNIFENIELLKGDNK